MSWKQLPDKVAVTFENVPYAYPIGSYFNTFQIELFFDGRIVLSYLDVRVPPAQHIVGLSAGISIPFDYNTSESDLSAYSRCCTGQLSVTDSVAPADDGTIAFGTLDIGASKTAYVTLTNTAGCDVIIDSAVTGVHEDFNDGLAQNWKMDSDVVWEIASGELTASTTKGKGINESPAIYTAARMDDLHYEARIRTGGNLLPPGLLFRATPDFDGTDYIYRGSGYAFLIDPYYGRYAVYKRVDGVGSYLCPWTPSTLIDTGAAYNKLAVDAVGPQMQFYINGQLVATQVDASVPSGYAGLFVSSTYYYSTNNVWFDDLIAYPLVGSSHSDPRDYVLNSVPALPMILGPDQSADIGITYCPTRLGQSSARLYIATRGSDQPFTEVLLTGSCLSGNFVGRVKMLADGATVSLRSKIVSAVFADRFYIQEPDRSVGICVMWQGQMPAIGAVVDVSGTLTTTSGERSIAAESVSP